MRRLVLPAQRLSDRSHPTFARPNPTGSDDQVPVPPPRCRAERLCRVSQLADAVGYTGSGRFSATVFMTSVELTRCTPGRAAIRPS